MGNGDYFCLNANEGIDSKVYYVPHDGEPIKDADTFEMWLKKLPAFLA